MFNEDAKKNMYSGILYQACTLIVGFLLRKYLVDYLGIYNLGVTGVFENAMAMLNLLDFGIGSACMYYLYKAFAKENREQVATVYVYFRKIYRKVALAILVIGLLVLLNIQLIIDIENNRLFLQLVFALFLLKAVLNHLLICPRTCLQCDGKRYIGTVADLGSMIVFAFIKIYFLTKTGSLVIYLIILIIEMLMAVLYIYYRFIKEYRDIDFSNAKRDEQIEEGIAAYSRSLAVSNINFVVYSSTDNIVLSKFCGTVIVGYMSNYYMIVNAVKGFLTQVTSAVEANLIKNYNVDHMDKKAEYDLSMFFCFVISSFCGVCLYNLTDPFISLYFGQGFVLDKKIILFMSIALLIAYFKKPSSTVVISRKMVNREIPFTVSMMVTNIVLSILLSYKLGPVGVLLGTVISESILFIGDEILAYNSGIGLGKDTLIKKTIYILIVVLEYIISSRLMISVGSYFDWLIDLVICTLVIAAFTLLFFRTEEFKALIGYMFRKKKG